MLTDAIGPIGATVLLLAVAFLLHRVLPGRRPTPFDEQARRDYRELGERLREQDRAEAEAGPR
jgi:hypothetical protein